MLEIDLLEVRLIGSSIYHTYLGLSLYEYFYILDRVLEIKFRDIRMRLLSLYT